MASEQNDIIYSDFNLPFYYVYSKYKRKINCLDTLIADYS